MSRILASCVDDTNRLGQPKTATLRMTASPCAEPHWTKVQIPFFGLHELGPAGAWLEVGRYLRRLPATSLVSSSLVCGLE
jgi:hypothetical protein